MTIVTVHKILNALLGKEIIERIETDNGLVRYHPASDKHYHLYSPDHNHIEDYSDPALTKILDDYFMKKPIPGFTISKFNLQILGKFTEIPEK
jgi:Fur family peroxide stress response transcriptional regulator